MDDRIRGFRAGIMDYAVSNELVYTIKALEMIQEVVNCDEGTESQRERRESALLHAYEVCTLLIDLQPSITKEEADTMLAAELIHIYPENYAIESLEDKLSKEYGFSAQITELTRLLITPGDITVEEQQELCERIQSNKLALLAALADRGNVIERVYQYSTWLAHRYISESKAYYMPMAIYGKEHYRELVGTIAILMEKLRTLLEVAEIFLTRFEVREAELTQDILALHEENATIRGIIADFRKGMQK